MASSAALVVTAKDRLSDGVVGLTLAHPDGDRLPDWTPGAHVDVVLPDGTARQFSLCGDRRNAHAYRIAVLREPDGRGGSAYVHDTLRVGDPVGLGGPRNNFPLVPADSYLFVAGGIGITPLLPMIEQADALDADWRLLYGGRHRSTMAFLPDLARYGDRVVVAPEDECGLLDLPGLLGTLRPGTRVYCCGPAPLLAAAEALCRAWPPYSLHVERFTPKEFGAPAQPGPFDVELRRSRRTVTVPDGSSVLTALRQAGIGVLSSCQQGVCGTCETTVLAGLPDHRDSILADHERDAGDRMYICVSRARTDRIVLDL
jgi:ferredoxin-NADP reductase